jgi:large subunit ribosomal protein L30
MAVKRIHETHEKPENKEYPLIKIKLKKSMNGRTQKQRAIIKGLGLRKIDSEVTREKRPEILGMIDKVNFMLQVSDLSDLSNQSDKSDMSK